MKKILAILLFSSVFISTLAQAALYGVSLNGFDSGTPGASSLYLVDEATGAGTLIGTNLGYAVNSVAIDPTTGLMYASTTTWDTTAPDSILSVDPATGTATVIGATGIIRTARTLTFDSAGNLWGWSENGDDPVTIDKTTGAATVVGPGTGTGRQVMAFDSANNLILIQGTSVYTIDQGTGVATLNSTLTTDPGNGGAGFHPTTGELWASDTSGQTLDSVIRVTDVAGDTSITIDTDITYLIALTFGNTGPTTNAIPTLSFWGLMLLSTLLLTFSGIFKRNRQ